MIEKINKFPNTRNLVFIINEIDGLNNILKKVEDSENFINVILAINSKSIINKFNFKQFKQDFEKITQIYFFNSSKNKYKSFYPNLNLEIFWSRDDYSSRNDYFCNPSYLRINRFMFHTAIMLQPLKKQDKITKKFL